MGETIKDKHRIADRDFGKALPPDSKWTVEMIMALDAPPVQPVPPPACPAWVPWAQHRP